MALPVIADVSRVAVQGTCPNGQPWVNVLHFKNTLLQTRTAFEVDVLTQLNSIYTAGGVAGAGTSGWATVAGTGATASKATVTPLDGVSASTELTLGITGAATGDPLPSDTALVSTFRTGIRGRSFRGRTYWAGITEANNNASGKMLAANVTEILANWAALLPIGATNGALLVVASYTLGVATEVTSVSVNDVFDRQRRRKQ